MKQYMEAKGLPYLPPPSEIQYEYWNLRWALRKRGYLVAVSETGLPAQPDYYDQPQNLEDEIERLFMSAEGAEPTEEETQAEEQGSPDDGADEEDKEPPIPSYADLASHQELYNGLLRVGGICSVFPPTRTYGRKVELSYFDSLDNLRVEAEIWAKRLRIKYLPTFAQLQDKHRLLAEAFLARGGYAATAALLELPIQVAYLKEPTNMEWELKVLDWEPDEADADAGWIGLPDLPYGAMPTERELRKAKRPDLHKAIENHHGGYYHAAKATHRWLRAGYWVDNPSLKREMKRLAYLNGHPKILPDRDELVELERHDLARAVTALGGLRKTAELVGLQPKKPTRRNERTLGKVGKKDPFLPYPFRRFDPKMEVKVGGVRFCLEVVTDIAKEDPEELGVWAMQGEATLGRIGRIRRKLRPQGEWLYRAEGESAWRGRFDSLSRQESVNRLNEITLNLAGPEHNSGRSTGRPPRA
ncbi:hypothetical protein [Fimbriimonas ginsengisoli]|uniref:hypothetical protein n=1 Tax=Fimbriimonas ginsengisoli TaxID=1005039 RepID=UPI00046CBF27|nr:hypothetical protein [Fimbriimonas ginsengisoli]